MRLGRGLEYGGNIKSFARCFTGEWVHWSDYSKMRAEYQGEVHSIKSQLEAAQAQLTRLHARIEDLEEQLSAIGAGGVEPLRKQAAETSNDILTMADALIIQRTADARDADRYRWLRDNDLYVNKELEPVVRMQLNAIWDVKIDEAMAAQARNKKGTEQ